MRRHHYWKDPFRRLKFLESLEPRLPLASHVWTGLGASDDWDLPDNWDGGVVPAAGDTALFNNANGSSVKLYGNQTKTVKIQASAGNIIIDLNGFDFNQQGISTHSQTATNLTITGPGSLLSPFGGVGFDIGGIGVASSVLLTNITKFEFDDIKIGGLGHYVVAPDFSSFELVSAGSGKLEVRGSMGEGTSIQVGVIANGQGELVVTQESAIELTNDVIVGIRSRGEVAIIDSSLQSQASIVVGEGWVEEPVPPETHSEIVDGTIPGYLTLTR
ncbi:MAG: hypothetical protein SFU86_11340 [Pirellulaceae bacterium]|nr:hypothetical protein [Pirellulaceae bacterium]